MKNYELSYSNDIAEKDYNTLKNAIFSLIELKINQYQKERLEQTYKLSNNSGKGNPHLVLNKEIIDKNNSYLKKIENLRELKKEFSEFEKKAEIYSKAINEHSFIISYFIKDVINVYNDCKADKKIDKKTNKIILDLNSNYSDESDTYFESLCNDFTYKLQLLKQKLSECDITSVYYEPIKKYLDLDKIEMYIKIKYTRSKTRYIKNPIENFKYFEETENKVNVIKEFEKKIQDGEINYDYSKDLLEIKSLLDEIIKSEKIIVCIDAALKELYYNINYAILHYSKTNSSLKHIRYNEKDILSKLYNKLSNSKYSEIERILNEKNKKIENNELEENEFINISDENIYEYMQRIFSDVTEEELKIKKGRPKL